MKGFKLSPKAPRYGSKKITRQITAGRRKHKEAVSAKRKKKITQYISIRTSYVYCLKCS
ncbi:hypothetical protein AB1A81_10470 [Bdellovibrio bacteriovorus]|uniref:hypothetical protein n=1 Tax=Bdellovibrio bacteriovorus TaxID=959 RepID=UPI00138AE74B|nr:hypothetical protein [Bdellovibrio bacteriovorus]